MTPITPHTPLLVSGFDLRSETPLKTQPSAFDRVRENLNANESKPVSNVPGSPDLDATSPLRARLEQIESRFDWTGIRAGSIGKGASPQQLLRLQHDVYAVSEDVQILSKMVEQASNSLKMILQTQV